MVKHKSRFNLFILFIKFYQKYLSVIFGYGCCRYYPTCSEYALISFKNKNIFTATIQTIIRVLKCNPIFDIGFDYPVISYVPFNKRRILNIYKKNKQIEFFLVPLKSRKNKFYIIKKL